MLLWPWCWSGEYSVRHWVHNRGDVDWVGPQVEIRGYAKRCCIVQDICSSDIESNWILILNYIAFGRHVERMKLKKCVAHLVRTKCRRDRLPLVNETYILDNDLKVYTVEAVVSKWKHWNNMKVLEYWSSVSSVKFPRESGDVSMGNVWFMKSIFMNVLHTELIICWLSWRYSNIYRVK